MSRDLIIDIYEDNPITSWQAILDGGVKAVYARLGEADYLDKRYASHTSGAKVVGLPYGCYYVCNPHYTVDQHMTFVKANYDTSSTLAFAADMELNFQCSNTFLLDWGHSLLVALEAYLGYKPIIYTGRWWWNPNMSPPQKWFANYRYWLSTYPGGFVSHHVTWPELKAWLPTGWTAPVDGGPTPITWQVSGDEVVLPGLGGNLDVSITDRLDEMKIGGSGPGPTPIPFKPVPFTVTDKGVPVLNVPYVSQIGPGANLHCNDCGAACASMLIAAYTGDQVSPDEVYDKTGASGDVYLAASQLTSVMLSYNLQTVWDQAMTLGELFEVLSARKPFIALIKYASLQAAGLTESHFTGMHFVVVVGADVKTVYIHDPLWKTNGGKFLAVPQELFLQCWTEAGTDPNLPNPTRGAVIPVAGLGDIIQAGKKVKVTAPDGLNIRAKPSANSAIISGLQYGAVVFIDSENTGWGKLTGRDGWINLSYTKPA